MEKIKITRKRIIEVNNTVMGTDVKGVAFNFKIAKLQKAITPIIESIQKAEKPSDKYNEYQSKLNEALSTYGTPTEQKGYYSFENDEKRKSFIEQNIKLEKEYKEVIDERKKQVEELDNILLEEEEIEYEPIDLEDVPLDISTKQMNILIDFIRE